MAHLPLSDGGHEKEVNYMNHEIDSEMRDDVLNELTEALAITMCAEDASTEEHVKLALSMVNGILHAVKCTLENRT